MARPILIAPSVLPCDFSRLGEGIVALDQAGVDRIQWDVMDGRFVPNLTFGPDVIASCRPLTALPFEAHLMVEQPHELAPRYVEAGCERLIVHEEACVHLHRTLGAIRDLGAYAAVALNPATPIANVAHVLDLVDLILVMTINPGFGGQAYLPSTEPKLRELRELIRAHTAATGHEIDIEVDGGIGPQTVGAAAANGANVLVAGTALFKDPDGLAHAVGDLRRRAMAAYVGP
jgi:ribulose-phosphate 3-epimerase